MLNHTYQFCQWFDFIASDSRNAVCPTRRRRRRRYMRSCLRCVYGLHARLEFSDSHGRRSELRSRTRESRKRPGATRRSLISVLRYISPRAISGTAEFSMQNNRMSMSKDRRMYNIDHRLLPTRVSLNITSRVAVSVSAGNVTCRGYIATRARCRRFYAWRGKVSSRWGPKPDKGL